MTFDEAKQLESALLDCPVCGKQVRVVKIVEEESAFGVYVDEGGNFIDIDTEVDQAANVHDIKAKSIICDCGEDWTVKQYVKEWKKKLGIKGDVDITVNGF
jgi:hypothetical protein